jgi:protein TonB
MSRKSPFVVFSVLAHGALAFGLGRMEVRASHAATAIEIAELPKPKQAPSPPAKVDPEPPKRAPERSAPRHVAAAPAPAENTPPKEAASHSTADALPDFGLSLSGGVGGNGVALPAAGVEKPSTATSAQVHRNLSASPMAHGGDCEDPVVKPKPRQVPQPVYTTSARAAGIEGKVRVKLTVDETGRVVNVVVIEGLGYGLDETAVAAAKAAEFEPATRCGKPVSATFTISMRFTAT